MLVSAVLWQDHPHALPCRQKTSNRLLGEKAGGEGGGGRRCRGSLLLMLAAALLLAGRGTKRGLGLISPYCGGRGGGGLGMGEGMIFGWGRGLSVR